MDGRECSIIGIVYSSPQLKSCPIEATFKIIGKKWAVLIIREMFRGTKQFNRFLESIDGITPKVLTERLRELEKMGIIKRRIVSEYPVKVEYELTDLGKAFEPVLLVAGAFSMRYMPETVFKDGRAREFVRFALREITQTGSGELIEPHFYNDIVPQGSPNSERLLDIIRIVRAI